MCTIELQTTSCMPVVLCKECWFFCCNSHKQLWMQCSQVKTFHEVQAGMVTTLNARASIIAAMNPSSHWDSKKSVTGNTGLATPLISRFDLVMIMLDATDVHQYAPLTLCNNKLARSLTVRKRLPPAC